MKTTLLLVVLACGCVGDAYTPAARAFPTESAFMAPDARQDIQLEGGASSFIFAPTTSAASIRLRHAASDGVIVSGEAGMSRVTGNDPPKGPPAATARIGVMLRREQRFAVTGVFAGLGGGTTSLGNGDTTHVGGWGSADLGYAVTFTGWHYVRPTATLAAYASLPIATTPFAVIDTSELEMRRLPTTFGFQTAATIEFGPPDMALFVGVVDEQRFAMPTELQTQHTQFSFGLTCGIRLAL